MSRVFLDILIVIVAAKLAAEIAERIKIPAVVGEIVAGLPTCRSTPRSTSTRP